MSNNTNSRVVTQEQIDEMAKILSFGDPKASIGSVKAGPKKQENKSNNKRLIQGGFPTVSINDEISRLQSIVNFSSAGI